MKTRFLAILLLIAALPCVCWSQAQWNGIGPQQASQTPLALHVTDGDLTSILGTFRFSAQTVLLPPNATSYVYLDMTPVVPTLQVNQSGFPTGTIIYEIAIATTNSVKITALTDARPPFNKFLFNGAGGAGGYNTIDLNAVQLTQRSILNFIGGGVNCVDNGGLLTTDCTIPGGIVGPGTPGTTAIFNTSTTIKNGSCTDDLVNPYRCPNGVNTANNGNYDEWTVDTGGVVANKLVCRSASSAIKVVICPPGSTNTVVGVALSTVSAGGTVIVGWAGKLQVVSSNATTQQHWLIPSVSVAGDVDDVGSTVPPSTGIFTVPAENSVGAGQIVQITLFALDTFQQSASTGTITSCSADGIAYYTAPIVINCLPSPTSPGLYFVAFNVPSTSGVVPIAPRAGAAGRVISGTTDTIVVRDRDPKILYYTSATGASITVPDVGSAGFDQSPVFGVVAANATGGQQTFTFTRQTSSTITVINGSSVSTGTSFSLTTGQFATFSTSDGANWTVRVPGGIGSGYNTIDQAGSALPQRNIVNFIPGNSGTVSCVDNSGVPRTDCTITVPKGTIAISDLAPVVGDDGLILVIDPAVAIHLTRFACGVQGTTSVVANMVKGGNSLMADQTCTAGSVETVTTSTFVNGSGQCGGTSNCAVAAHAPVTLHIGTISGSPTALQVSVEFTID